MPLYLSTTILSHIFITLITLFLPGNPRWSMRQEFHLQVLTDVPGLTQDAFIFLFRHAYLWCPRPDSNWHAEAEVFETSKSTIPSLGQITHLEVAHPLSSITGFVLSSQITNQRVLFLWHEQNKAALASFAHKHCALRPGPTTLLFSQGRVSPISNGFFHLVGKKSLISNKKAHNTQIGIEPMLPLLNEAF